MEAFILLEHLDNKKVLLFNADVLSHKVSRKDRNSYPLIGDAATVTVIENDKNSETIHMVYKTDGSRRDALIIPAGGSRLPSSAETGRIKGRWKWKTIEH